MFRATLISLFLLLSAVILPSSVRASDAETVTVTLTSFDFTPETLNFKASQDYVLELSNTSSGGHSFGAKDFFKAATIAAEDQKLIKKGKIEVPAGETVTIRLTTGAAGTYKLKCTHFLHSGFGMKGTIVVS